MLNNFSKIDSQTIKKAAEEFGTPLYLYDEKTIKDKCKELLDMPNAFGLYVRFAMKANPSKGVLNTIVSSGLNVDASSLNEVRRANMAGVPFERIVLTTQEVPDFENRKDLEDMILKGLKYNVCSLRQLYLITDFAKEHGVKLSIRIHPGVGAGESASRNTGDNYSCFGVHLSNLPEALEHAKKSNLIFDQVHVHIGSGGDPITWRENIDTELGILEEHFPQAETVSFGGGLKEARCPNETAANVKELGEYAKLKINSFFERTGRKLKMEIEPGTFVMANSGYIITKVIDKKQTGADGLHFIIANGGMEVNARPLLYGSEHPFYIVSSKGELLSSDFNTVETDNLNDTVIVGRCCESGDAQRLSADGRSLPVKIANTEIGDYVVIGGTGAYSSSVSPFNYNSHTQIPEVIVKSNGELCLIRKRQTLAQIVENEI